MHISVTLIGPGRKSSLLCEEGCFFLVTVAYIEGLAVTGSCHNYYETKFGSKIIPIFIIK
jgi:hypothetical protein